MSEVVTITPLAGKKDADGDPIAAGVPFPLKGRVAPGNTVQRFAAGGELEAADFTIFFPLRAMVGDVSVRVIDALTEDFTVALRGRVCRGRAQLWDERGAGGVVVLALSRTGKGGA